MGYGYEQQRDWVVSEILKQKHNGYSKEISSDDPDAFEHVFRATHWVPPHRRGDTIKPYKAEVPVSWARNSANLKLDARKRIEKAVADLVEAGKRFGIRALAKAAQCSTDTLYNHKDLWLEAKQRLDDRLASDPGEYNAGVGAAAQESQPPAQSPKRWAPPGLLSARRIAFEIRRRAEAEIRRKHKYSEEEKVRAAQSWKEEVELHLPENPDAVELNDLLATTVFLKVMLGRSPDEESQVWLQEKIQSFNDVLEDKKSVLENRKWLSDRENLNDLYANPYRQAAALKPIFDSATARQLKELASRLTSS